MRRLFIAIALLCGLSAPLCLLSLEDVQNAASVCSEKVVMVIVRYIQYLFPDLFPAQEGIKASLIWAYLGTKGFIGRMFGQEPQTVYTYVIERAKNNPLEAIGALTLVAIGLWCIYIIYRTMYRSLCWVLIPKRFH